jgi:hypothetical protein
MRVSELAAAVSEQQLSAIQVEILQLRLTRPLYWTFARLRGKFEIATDKSLRRAFIRTASGQFWAPAMDGGRDFYLSPLDNPKFEELIRKRASDLNCITGRDASLIATDLVLQRRKIAVMLLQAALVETPPVFLRKFLDVAPPCREWLHEMIQPLRLYISSTREIEAIRREFCACEAIPPFFAHFRSLINGRDPGLVFAMHEEQLSARKLFRGLVDMHVLSLVEAETKVAHITGMCTVCAGGDRFRPIVILKQAMSLELLAQFNNLASFASSTSGWTTSDLFAMFAIDFCDVVQCRPFIDAQKCEGFGRAMSREQVSLN